VPFQRPRVGTRAPSETQEQTRNLRAARTCHMPSFQPTNTRSPECEYVRKHPECQSDSGARASYATFFCTCLGASPGVLGFIVLVLWLACLFFMLGNTAADYFCPALGGALFHPAVTSGRWPGVISSTPRSPARRVSFPGTCSVHPRLSALTDVSTDGPGDVVTAQ